MEFCQLLCYCRLVLDVVLLQKLFQQCFTLLLCLAIDATQYSLYFGLGLGSGDKIDPPRLYML